MSRRVLLQKIGGDTFLLDDFGGSATAFSLRYLSSSFVGSDVVLVRRSSDNAELGFTPTEINDGTLTTWVGAGNNGFVKTWYDQSGNTNDGTQIDTGRQPKIVISGTLVTKNGYPSIDFDHTRLDYLIISSTLNENSFTVHAGDNYSISVMSLLASNVNNGGVIAGGLITSITGIGMSDGGINPSTYSVIEDFNMHLTNAKFGGTSKLRIDGSDIGTSTLNINTINQIGLRSSGFGFGGTFQEAVIYATDQTANNSGIEGNINDYYTIY